MTLKVKYRIRPVGLSEYKAEYKGWFFWHSCETVCEHYLADNEPRIYKNFDAAEKAIDRHYRHHVELRRHQSPGPVYIDKP